MSDHQRIRGLGGIKPSRMPSSAQPGIPVAEAEFRLGIVADTTTHTATQAASVNTSTPASSAPVLHERHTAVFPHDLPESLQNRKPKLITVSRTFRLPLELVDELEAVAALHEIPMVAIVAEAIKLHLTRFPRQKT